MHRPSPRRAQRAPLVLPVLLSALWAVAAVLALGCAPASSAPGPSSPSAPAATPAQVGTVVVPSATTPFAPAAADKGGLAVLLPEGAGSPDDSHAAVPVGQNDPVWGSPSAPVTVVIFTDYQCPFCGRMYATLRSLRDTYGEQRLRLVLKHYPLPFHPYARDTAIAAEAVRALGGNRAFWAFTDLAFANQLDLGTNAVEDWVRAAGVDVYRFRSEVQNPVHARKVDDDLALGNRLGVRGTPNTFIDGRLIAGAQPAEQFTSVIDDHLRRAGELVRGGTPSDQVYRTLTQQEFHAPESPSAVRDAPDSPSAVRDAPAAPDTTVYKVPLGLSPIRGPRNALVTIVMFGDFQCPFTARATATMADLMARYPNDVRLVWKDNPLPFHLRAKAAAIFAREARAEHGDRAFWTAFDKLFAGNRNLEDSDLEQYARELGMNVSRTRNSIASNAFSRQIADDQALASQLKAAGTPTFFINGRKLLGAQPIDKFVQLVDEELAKARAVVAKGVPAAQVYDRIQKDATTPPEPGFEHKTVPAPGTAQPSRGARGARVVIQQFSDFQCPFCARVEPTLAQLEKKYSGRLRIVWRNLPLPFHTNAQLAAEAAYEAFTQKGNDGFWRYHDLLFTHQRDPGGLERPALEVYAAQLGLDMTRFRNALDNHTHAGVVQADADIAKAAGIQGTPGFVINGFFVSGAQPQEAFERVIDAILAGRAH